MLGSMRGSILLGVLLAVPYVRASGQSARISGTVTDSVHRAPLVDATVLATPVAPTRDTVFHAARTDASGRFTIDRLQVGTYVVSVEHAFTDSIGLSVPSRDVKVAESGESTVALALPSVATLRRALCGPTVKDFALGVMLGAVRRTDGGTVADATVVFQWTELEVDRKTLTPRSTRMTASATTDSSGVYRACGMPTQTMLLVQAQHGPEQSGIIEERIGEAGVLVRELMLGDTARTTTLASGADTSSAKHPDTSSVRGAGVVRGVVLGDHLRPIANAQVHLFGAARAAITNAAGEFRLTDIPTGTQGFEVLALGYAPRRFRVEVSSDGAALTVTMSKIAAVLDSIRVTARQFASGGRYKEFDERSRVGHGRYITERDVERKQPFVTTDLIRMMPGVQVAVGKDGEHVLSMRRCAPAIYVDGMLSTLPLDAFPPSWIHGIEVYQVSEAPAQYRGDTNCGAILIWSK